MSTHRAPAALLAALAPITLGAAGFGDQPAPTALVGKITDEAGRPVPGVKVQLYGGLATRLHGQSATTDDTGAYRFEPLETGAWSERGLDTGIRLGHDSMVSADGASWWDLNIPHGQTTTHDFTMRPGGRLAGRLTDHEGFGWSEFDLRFEAVDTKAGVWYATTAHKGDFSTDAMQPGEYRVQWNNSHADYAELTRVTIEPGRVTELDIAVKVSIEPTAKAATKPM